MRGDRGRVGDHLVLEARVELHVARLVDLLGGEEGRLLLGAIGADQAGELGGDPLLGDHQRGQHPEDQPPVLLAQLVPLLAVGARSIAKGRPLLVLPVAVEGLRVVEVDLGHRRSLWPCPPGSNGDPLPKRSVPSFRKLEISSRRQLPDVLAGAEPPEPRSEAPRTPTVMSAPSPHLADPGGVEMFTKIYALALFAVVAVLAIAGCGGGSDTESSGSTETSSGEANGSTLSGATDTAIGTVLVDSEGFTVYMFGKDKGTTSACYGPCAENWPPLNTKGAPSAGEGAMSSEIGTTRRKDGMLQVTYAGHPLYTYIGDSSPGEANGNELDFFGGVWLALDESGAAVEGTESSEEGFRYIRRLGWWGWIQLLRPPR